MLTLDQTLEALALALPRIPGDLSPFALPIALTFDREIYPYLVAAVQSADISSRAKEALKNYAYSLTRTGRRQLLVRSLDAILADAYAVAEPWVGCDYDRTEPLPVDVRNKVISVWDASHVYSAMYASLVTMYELHTSDAERRAAIGEQRYVGEHVELTRDCDLGSKGERAVVSVVHDGTIGLLFKHRVEGQGRQMATGADYAYLRHVCGCDLKATDGNHGAQCPDRGKVA